jgi:hypothetical protein
MTRTLGAQMGGKTIEPRCSHDAFPEFSQPLDEREPLLTPTTNFVANMDKVPSNDTTQSKLEPTKSRRRSSVNAADDDALRLAELGYTQELSRKFSVWSILGVGFSLTNSWFGLSAAMVTGINSGGTALIIYGVIIVACVSACVAISLSELTSAMPSAGGQ